MRKCDWSSIGRGAAFTRLVALALLVILCLRPAFPADSADVLLADFDGATYPAGWTTTGTAFGTGPAHGTLPNQMPVAGYEGAGLVNSYIGSDASIGTLTSPEFSLSRHYLSFLIGGGHHPGEEEIQLWTGGQLVRHATGPNSETLGWMQWDVSGLMGKSATIKIIDTASGGWGHICIDSIKLTDVMLPDERTLLSNAAVAAVRKAIPAAEADPNRPAYHFHAPANWMNDPNGPIYYKGWYHIFYQFNPYGSQWGNMHWGHARSKDLVDWEQLPVALWPSRREGEEHVYSGSSFPRADGTPMAFYTSIGDRDPEQWAAVADDSELLKWTKVTANPVVSSATRGGQKFAEWRDPFLFALKGKTFLVTGGGDQGNGIVALYRAENSDLTDWKYLGIIFRHPDSAIHNIECPNFAEVDGKWVLLTSTYGKVESFVGQFDVDKPSFTWEKRGVLGDGSYASQLLRDTDGRLVHLAWMNTGSGSGWNGYISLPSLLTLAGDGTLLRMPIPALAGLRDADITVANQPVSGTLDLTPKISGNSLEIVADIDPGSATSVSLRLRASADATRATHIRYVPATRTLYTDGRAPVVLPASTDGLDWKVHVFLDRGALDVYTAGGAVTQAAFFGHIPQGDTGVQVSAEGGTARIVRLDAYTMKPATFDNSRLK